MVIWIWFLQILWGGVLNDHHYLYRIRGNNYKHSKNTCLTIVLIFLWKLCPLNIDKLTFHCFTDYFILRCKKEGKSYILSYYTKMHAALIQMYLTVKVYITADFISELHYYMKGMSSTIEWCIQNIGNKYEAGKFPCPYPPAGECVILCNTSTSLNMFYPGHSLTWNGT